jgi:hypothetical protein
MSLCLASLRPAITEAKGDAVDEPKDEVPSYEGENTATTFKRYSARTEMYRKFKRGKDINNYSATAMQEIMGKSTGESSGATITYAPSYPSASLSTAGASSSSSTIAPVKAEPQQAELVTVKSSQSIQDYFKNKMAAAAAAQKPASRFQVASGAGFSEDFQADYAESMKASAYSGRIGLGFGSHAATPFSGMRLLEMLHFTRHRTVPRRQAYRVLFCLFLILFENIVPCVFLFVMHQALCRRAGLGLRPPRAQPRHQRRPATHSLTMTTMTLRRQCPNSKRPIRTAKPLPPPPRASNHSRAVSRPMR